MIRIRLTVAPALALLLVAAACASGPAALPESRPLVLHSGTRLLVDDEPRLRTIYDEVSRELVNIVQDPSFLIESNAQPGDAWPWETLEIEDETARISYQRTAGDVVDSYQIYAHLHLMKRMGRVDEWLPEAADAEGWELERAILGRVADAWLMGRTLFGMAPYRLLDELVYASEAGQLEALVLTLRADEYPRERETWLAENPGADGEFESWYRTTFDEDPPKPPGAGGARP